MRIKREDFLQELEAVSPGLTPKAIIDQSDCVVFKDGKAITFNDEVACSHTSTLKEVEGAVSANKLIALLKKLTEDMIEITWEEDKLWVIGSKKKKYWFALQKEITLPVGVLEEAKDWLPLHEDFTEAVKIVQSCAGKNEQEFLSVCVHIHPKWVEAANEFEMAQYRLKTGFPEQVLVRRDSLKHIIPLDMTEFSLTANWIHFRNPAGLMMSCRRTTDADQYPSLTERLQVEGTSTALPKGLVEAIERASIFSKENGKDNEHVIVILREGRIRVKGECLTGGGSEPKRINYQGAPMQFLIDPELLIEITKKANECLISPNKIMVDGGRWKYASCLGIVEKNGEKT